MANYKEMYFELLGEMTKAIELLQEAQKRTEMMYMLSGDAQDFDENEDDA